MKIDNETIGQLAKSLVQPDRLQAAAGLAGAGLQMPYATLRRREAQRELARIVQRDGAKSAGAVRQGAVVASLSKREIQVAADFACRAAPAVQIGPEQASLQGKITCDGVPVMALDVLILDEKRGVVGQTCTGRDGRYGIAVPADHDLRLELRQGEKPVYRDKNSFAFPQGYAGTRDIDIGSADPVCAPFAPDDRG